MRLGLLEDDAAIQEMLMLVFQDEGYTVLPYAGGEECLEALGIRTQELADVPVDLMIVDLCLNGPISGAEVIQQIRTHPRLKALPIILMTAATLDETNELQSLQVILLEKPFSVDEMLSLIQDMTHPHSIN